MGINQVYQLKSDLVELKERAEWEFGMSWAILSVRFSILIIFIFLVGDVLFDALIQCGSASLDEKFSTPFTPERTMYTPSQKISVIDFKNAPSSASKKTSPELVKKKFCLSNIQDCYKWMKIEAQLRARKNEESGICLSWLGFRGRRGKF